WSVSLRTRIRLIELAVVNPMSRYDGFCVLLASVLSVTVFVKPSIAFGGGLSLVLYSKAGVTPTDPIAIWLETADATVAWPSSNPVIITNANARPTHALIPYS